MCTLEDEDAQRNGIVNIYNSIGDAGSDPQVLEVLRHASLLDDGLPYRSNATHFCYDSAALRPLLQLLQLVAGKENRIRFRTHFGTSQTILSLGWPLKFVAMLTPDILATPQDRTWNADFP